MTGNILQLLLNHKSFRNKLSEFLTINPDNIDNELTMYDRTIENEDYWFSINIVCKDGTSHNITTRRLPHKSTWEFKSYGVV